MDGIKKKENMMKVTDKIKQEPVMSAAAITPLLMAVLYLLRSFGVNLTDEQQEAVIAVAVVVIPLLLAWLARAQVTPTAAPRNDAGEALVTVAEAEATLGPVGGVR